MSDHRTDTIRALNDAARATFTGCLVLLTDAFEALPLTTRAQVLKKVREYDDFDDTRFPEHRVGYLDHEGEVYIFEIIYRDLTLQTHSPDPANPRVTRRVLTIGIASMDLPIGEEPKG
jgi:hypothetical protein